MLGDLTIYGNLMQNELSLFYLKNKIYKKIAFLHFFKILKIFLQVS